MGLAGDRKANDGIFTGQIKLDVSPAAASQQLSRLAEKLNAKPTQVGLFRGRGLVERRKLPKDAGFGLTPISDPRITGRFQMPKFVLPGLGVPLPPLCNESSRGDTVCT